MRLSLITLTMLLLVGTSAAAETWISLELDAGHLVLRNRSSSPVQLSGVQINARADCYLLPTVRRSDGRIVLMPAQAVEQVAKTGEFSFSLDDLNLRVGDAALLRLERSPCLEKGSAIVLIRAIFRNDGAYGSYVDLPVPAGSSFD